MKQGDIFAAIVAILIGGPLVYVFARAIAEGQTRAEEAPFRAILGDEVYDELASGERTELHYMGDDRRAPDFTLRDERGEPWKLSDHRGKVVILNFWSITCRPCVEEMPTLIELGEMLADRDDVEVVTVSVDDGWDAVSSLFPRDRELEVLFDPEREIVRGKFGTRLYPETWFIDPEGVIRLRVDGPRDWSSPVVLDLIQNLK